jgi:hypothetical protein
MRKEVQEAEKVFFCSKAAAVLLNLNLTIFSGEKQMQNR